MAQFPEWNLKGVSVLNRLRSFVQSELPGAGAVSTASRIIISEDGRQLTGSLTTTRIGGLQVCDDPNTQISMSFQFTVEDTILHVFEALVACPTLTELLLILPSEYVATSDWPALDTFVVQVFCFLRRSRSLSALDIKFKSSKPDNFRKLWRQVPSEVYRRFFPRHLLTLLVGNSFLETLTIAPGDLYHQEDVVAIACSFSGNVALRSCTLRLHPCDRRRHPLRTVIGPFTTTVQSEANVGLKQLVLKSNVKDHGCEVCQGAIADLVARNTTMEKLEVGDHIFSDRGNHFSRGVMASAVGCNRTLKEIRFQCPVADLKWLVLVLVPDADGRQANTSLSTLKLSLTNSESVLDCMTDLGKLVESNTTLKHVQVCQEWSSLSVPRSSGFLWGKRVSSKKNQVNLREKDVESRLRSKLERMLNDELRRTQACGL